MKFKKKPVEVGAVQLLWQNWSEVADFAGVGKLSENKPEGCWVGVDGKAIPDQDKPDCTKDKLGLLIPTLEGVMLATQGDWVIRGIKNELYAVKPDIFELTYERSDGKLFRPAECCPECSPEYINGSPSCSCKCHQEE